MTLFLASCEHPIEIVSAHVEVADLLVADSTGGLIARTDFNRSWSVDSLAFTDGTALRIVLGAVDFRGQPVDFSARSDVSFRMEARDAAMVQWEPQRGFGWIRPFAAGTTEVRFLIWHINHADFVTPWLRVVVRPGATTNANPSHE